MSSSSRYLAFFAYLLSLPGALFVLLARRDDAFAVYHAKQSLGIAIAALATPLIWVVCAWVLAWVPLVGAMLGVALFALVLAAYVGLFVDWVTGMVYALQGKARRIPLTGPLAIRQPAARPAPPEETSASPDETHESTAELIERTSTSDA